MPGKAQRGALAGAEPQAEPPFVGNALQNKKHPHLTQHVAVEVTVVSSEKT